MKATIKNLKKALKACAKAHNCDFEDWSEDGEFGLHSTTVPVVADVRMILESFYGTHEMCEVAAGFTSVELYDYMDDKKRDVDELTLSLALPYGTKL